MRLCVIAALAAGFGVSAIAAEKRQLDSHEHGVGLLNIAFEDARIAMEFEAPGADIVGFEHEAHSAEDRAKIDAAIAALAKPLALFELPAGAGCSVVEAKAALVDNDSQAEHHDHHDHAEDHSDDTHHDDHAEAGDHAEAAGEHSEFRAEYVLSCADPGAVDRIEFAYFERFPNALELEVQLISDKGTTGFEVKRDAPSLSLAGAI